MTFTTWRASVAVAGMTTSAGLGLAVVHTEYAAVLRDPDSKLVGFAGIEPFNESKGSLMPPGAEKEYRSPNVMSSSEPRV